MKPTVIANNGNSNGNISNPGHENISSNDGNNNPNYNTGSRQQFSHPFQGFNFDTDIDDMFPNVRARLGRLPFGFGTRKTSNDPSRYFDDDDDDSDFFPHFGSLGRRRSQHKQPSQTTDRSGVFDHIPAEFRQYMPDAFEFSHPRSPRTQQQQPQPQYQQQSQPQYQQQPQPQYQQQQQPQYQQHSSPQQYYETYNMHPNADPPPAPYKSKLCDAAVQTDSDELSGLPAKPHRAQPIRQGLRNTVDLGQKSPPENEHVPRAQSAPPNDPNEQQQKSSEPMYTTEANIHISPTAYAYVPPPQHEKWQAQPQQRQQQQPPRSQAQQQHHPTGQQQAPQTPGGSYIRTVPIFVEGRSEPFVDEQKHSPPETHKQKVPQYKQAPQYHETPPKQFNAQQQQPQPQGQQSHQPYDQQQQQQQQQQPQNQHQPHFRPSPLNTQQANAPAPAQTSSVPQTPQTTATIEKIQSIQRDVLDLMSKIEKFSGVKSEKEYMYLDEMLTRNLLKLDTIDTHGKERIRLARKEAIKCIEASITVLEAKAEENAKKTAQNTVIETHTGQTNSNTEAINIDEINTTDTVVDKKPESSILDEASMAKLPDVVPLPPPPEKPHKSSENIQQEQTTPISTELTSAEIPEKPEEPLEKLSEITEELKPVEQLKDDPTLIEPGTKPEENENKKVEEKQSSPTKEDKPKESSPKKKIVKKIIKKVDKKDKKETATPPSEKDSETGCTTPVTEIK